MTISLILIMKDFAYPDSVCIQPHIKNIKEINFAFEFEVNCDGTCDLTKLWKISKNSNENDEKFRKYTLLFVLWCYCYCYDAVGNFLLIAEVIVTQKTIQ